MLKPIIPSPEKPVPQATLLSAPLAHLNYSEELRIKDEALALFWKKHRLAGQPETVIGSPKPRGYRTTSKRKTVLHGPVLHLLFGDKVSHLKTKQPFHPSPLEPKEHEELYRFLQKKLSESAFRLVASHLNYLIIRGSYTEQAVIFNVDKMNGPLVRKLKILAGQLQKLPQPASAAFAYLDPSHSDYYLESKRPADSLHFKRLFGPEKIMVRHDDCRYLYHPTSFSQINESMVPEMLRLCREILAPSPQENLLDLYCGYGLFSHFLAPHFNQVVAIDSEGPSIHSAISNRRLNSKRGGRIKFLAHRITGQLLDDVLSSSPFFDSVVLDPPRQGPQKGVIATISRQRPQNALHIFCGVDQIPVSLKEWKDNGYHVQRVVPLDMFPGTANLEIMVHLAPK